MSKYIPRYHNVNPKVKLHSDENIVEILDFDRTM